MTSSTAPNESNKLVSYPTKNRKLNEYGHFSPATILDFYGIVLINLLEEEYLECIKFSSEIHEYNESLETHIQ